LSSWFKDYLYIPLGGSKGGIWMKIRNTFIIFVVSGFWHGANWTYLAWGFINAVYFLPLLLLKKNRNNIESTDLTWNLESIKVRFNIIMTFLLSCVAWVFFRAKTITDAVLYLKRIATNGEFSSQYLSNERYNYELLIMVALFVLVEWNNRTKIEPISGKYSFVKLTLCLAAIIALGTYSDYKEFIYFQF
jgi:alginate O-acetyltransferase complex protein AlgI